MKESHTGIGVCRCYQCRMRKKNRRKPGQAGVTTGRWSGAAAPFAPATPNATERAVKALTAVVALTVRMAFFARGRKNKTIHIKHNHALCTRLA